MARQLFLVLFVLLGACGAPTAAPTPTAAPIIEAQPVPAARTDDYLQMSGSIAPDGSATHQIAGVQGQQLIVTLASPENQARLAITGLNDTVALLDAAAGANTWAETLPTTQMYDITISSANSTASVPYLLTVIIPETVNFGPGAVAAEVQGDLGADDVDAFLIAGQGGQPLSIAIAPAETIAGLQIYGVRDRTSIIPGGAQRSSWAGILPGDQEYLIEVSAAEPTSYALQVRLEAGAALAPVEVPLTTPDAADAARAGNGTMLAQPVVFAAGANQARIEAMSDTAAGYQLYGQAGQVLLLTIASPGDGVSFALRGLSDGIAIVDPAQPVRSWAGVLHAAQEYRVDVIGVNGQPPASFALNILLPDRLASVLGEPVQRSGTLDAVARTSYVVGLEAGRELAVTVDGPAILRIVGVSGQVLLGSEAGARSYTSMIPGTEDYVIELVPQGAGSYTLTVETR